MKLNIVLINNQKEYVMPDHLLNYHVKLEKSNNRFTVKSAKAIFRTKFATTSLAHKETILIYLRYLSVRLLFLFSFVLIIFGSYFYSASQVSFGSIILTNNYYQAVENMPTWLYSAEYFSFVFVYISIYLMLLIFFYKTNKTERRNARSKYIDFFVNGLFNYLYANEVIEIENHKKYLCKYWQKLNNEYAKRLFINIIRQVHLDTTGELHDKTTIFISDLQLDSFILSYLRSPFLRNNLFALKTIRDFHLEGYENYILKFTKRNNNILRSAALNTLVRFDKYDTLLFLIDYKIKLTCWDINNMISTIQYQRTEKIDYLNLINSNVPEISVLGIIFARLNKRIEFKQAVKEKIGTSNELVNEEAFITFISFAIEQDDFDFLIYKFNVATEKAKNHIIKNITTNPNTSDTIQFLEQIVENESFVQKLLAVQILLEIDLFAVAKLKRSGNPLIRQVCEQVLDYNN